jgi:hypothetical protein
MTEHGRAASRYEPRTRISQMPTAAIGTDTCVGMPASPQAAPMPTKSDMQIPKLAISTASVAKADQRMP